MPINTKISYFPFIGLKFAGDAVSIVEWFDQEGNDWILNVSIIILDSIQYNLSIYQLYN